MGNPQSREFTPGQCRTNRPTSPAPLEISEGSVQFPRGPGQGVLATLGFHIIENVHPGCVSQLEICSPGGFHIYFHVGVFLHGF